jgi:hypothetical protein
MASVMGHQTWLDDLRIPYVLQADRMGHEAGGMRGGYAHIAPEWRAELREGLQGLWEASLDRRVSLSERSVVPLLDGLLAARIRYVRSQYAPKIGH